MFDLHGYSQALGPLDAQLYEGRSDKANSWPHIDGIFRKGYALSWGQRCTRGAREAALWGQLIGMRRRAVALGLMASGPLVEHPLCRKSVPGSKGKGSETR